MAKDYLFSAHDFTETKICVENFLEKGDVKKVMKSLEYEIDLLSKMVEINTDSVSKVGYEKCASLIVKAADQNRLTAEIVNGENAVKDGVPRPNVIVTLDAGSDVTLLLESHFDVVPPGPNWSYSPFKLTVEAGKAYGRGAADNKSGIVAAIGAMRRLRKEEMDINLKLIAGVDEEIGGRFGADYVLSEYGLKGDAGLVLDSGSDSLYVGASGIIWGRITVKGKQGHAGYPFKAKNAINEAIKLLAALEPYKRAVEKKTSKLHAPSEAPRKFVWGRFSVTMIKAGEKENVIPGRCEIKFDRRLLPEEPIEQAENEFMDFFRQATEKTGCEALVEIIKERPGYCTQNNTVFMKTVCENIRKTLGKSLPLAGELGGNDGCFFAKNGIPVVCYGTIRPGTNYHGADEFVYLEDLRNTRDFIVNLGRVRREKIRQI